MERGAAQAAQRQQGVLGNVADAHPAEALVHARAAPVIVSSKSRLPPELRAVFSPARIKLPVKP